MNQRGQADKARIIGNGLALTPIKINWLFSPQHFQSFRSFWIYVNVKIFR